MKTILIGRKLVTKPWNTSAFYHAPQKGPIGCNLVMSYAKLLKLSYLISSSTDMRLTTNHTIKSKETCGNSWLNIKREDKWEFSQCELFRPRRKVHYYFRLQRPEVKHLSLICAETRGLISFYLYIKLINTKSTMKGPIPSTNQTKLICKTPGDFLNITTHTANYNYVTTSLQYSRQCHFLLIFIVFTPQE